MFIKSIYFTNSTCISNFMINTMTTRTKGWPVDSEQLRQATPPADDRTAGAAPAVRLPSRRASAALAAAMLAVGVAIGAAIGPSPESSFGSTTVPALLPYIARALQPPTTAGALAGQSATATSSTPFSAPQSTPASRPSASAASATEAPTSSASPSSSPSSSSSPSTGSTPSTGSMPRTTAGKQKTNAAAKTLPKITHVWLIVLSSGQSFTSVEASPSSTPFLSEQLIGQGTLLTNYSATAATELASAAAQLSNGSESGLSVISEPPCSVGGSPCAAPEPAGLTHADSFLGEVVPTITASPSYGQNGMVVITFGSSTQGISVPGAAPTTTPATGASGASPSSNALTGTLPNRPAAGALVLSALVGSGTRIQTSFQPLDPRKSLEQVLGG